MVYREMIFSDATSGSYNWIGLPGPTQTERPIKEIRWKHGKSITGEAEQFETPLT
jgi:hypothetical protein